jgi:predicted TIM-barrel fold metal-dependent hydrolase
MANPIGRRKFLAESSLAGAGMILGNAVTGCASKNEEIASDYGIMQEVMKYRKIDAHAHIFSSPDQTPEWHLDFADRLGIEKLQISRPRLAGLGGADGPETAEQVIALNDIVYKAMKQYPDRFIGFFTLNPVFKNESLEEIKRCVDMGFAGFKGFLQVKVNDPLYYPIIEKLIDLKMMCFMHAECELGTGGYRMKYDLGRAPNTTIPEDMVDAAKRYPEAMFQWAHIASGDFEYICKCIKDYPNIFIDVSSSNNEERHVDFCIEQLGEDRIFFASDNSYYQAVGKILASNATETQKKKIFFENYNNILKKSGHGIT